MPRVFIPPLLRPLTGGVEELEVPGTSVRQVVNNLESLHPGIRDRLCVGNDLRPGLAVAVDSQISTRGLLTRVAETSEVHFLPAIGGG